MKKPQPTRSQSELDRRTFLKATAVVGGAATLSGACADTGQKGAGRSADPRTVPVPEFELDEVTVADLQASMDSGQETARSISEKYLGRIEEIDRQGPELRAIIETNPEAVQIAESLDKERQAGNIRGPLHGIPVVLKDNIDTHDRMTTTAGSLALEGSIPQQDSFVAKRLREAGAVILAKANLSEWANFRADHSSSGWSGRGGQCRNPYELTRNPCGSSSGSGAATSANLTALSIGTETNGSVVCPANNCGLVGIKPTVGLVSRSGIIPISHTQDTAGPMCRTVRDAALLLSAIAGIDPRDIATEASSGNSHTDYTLFLEPEGLKGARIGVVRRLFGFLPSVERIMSTALEALQSEGAELIDPVELPSGSDYGRAPFLVLLYEFKADLNAYLASLGASAPVKSLQEVIEFNERNREREMPFFEQELLVQSQEKGPLTEQEYLDALEKTVTLSRNGIDKAMDEHRLDALISPTGGPAWKTDHLTGDHFSGGSSSAAARSGYPHVTVPAGDIRGLPVGLSFYGRAWSEPALLRLAHTFEQATQARKKPRFLHGSV